ncbi:hypothetical protein E4U09_005664 [Claviceps aff. purpurea]|uniref:YTH domain-containing protein n=1 Tax=Claviceps aff. purpurea TaxID=1967640 RepID=A0A9P7QE74_9HYPO|nr:hypothetical protein E4U09_005664 [Claviceps aff. purpurea]
MISAAGFGNPGQLNPRQCHNSYDVASRGIYNEEAMAFYPVQQPYHGAFNMAPMASTMPVMSYLPYQTGHYMHMFGEPYNFITPPPTLFQGQPMPHFYPYYVGPQTPVYPYYNYNINYIPQTCSQPGLHGPSNMVYYPGQMNLDYGQSAFFYPQGAQYQQPACMMPAHVPTRSHMPGAPNPDVRAFGISPIQGGRSQGNQAIGRIIRNPTADLLTNLKVPSSKRNAVRGPPRKPRQSDHALWIGNVPPWTDIMALLDHVCKETQGLESLLLIPKSQCAFTNYKDEATCSAARQRLDNSEFQSVRLISRLRKNAARCRSRSSASTGQTTTRTERMTEAPTKPAEASSSETPSPAVGRHTMQITNKRNTVDKFFILKSLTIEDLDASVRTGKWATQSHNEKKLNEAFQSAANVYLIFSANKSGEYFGYARMVSEIDNDATAAMEGAPKTMMASDVGLPSVPTRASEFAPRGRIIRDSAAGTIFWEAERDDHEAGPNGESETKSNGSGTTKEESQTLGKPFQLEWLSTTRLPFCHTGNLRNPWNSGREVKVARDGTEIEPSIGRRLVRLFNRMQMPASLPHQPPPSFIRGY